MPNIEVSRTIAATPIEVSDVLLDPEAATQWTAGLERFEVVSGGAGEPGAVAHAHYLEGGRRSTIRDQLLEAVPGERFASEITGGGMRARVETRLEPVTGGTRVTIRWNGRGTNPVSCMILAIGRRAIRRRARADLDSLAALVESRT